MISAELSFPIETAYVAMVLPIICAYLLLVAVAASRISRNERGPDSTRDAGPDRHIG